MDSEIKTFHDLMIEVQQRNFCGKCGGCFSFCSADNLGALEVGSDGMPRFANEEKCLHCGICYMICPNIYELDEELKKKTNWEPPIGAVEDLTSARTTNSSVVQRCTDGGVVTSLQSAEVASRAERDTPSAFSAETSLLNLYHQIMKGLYLRIHD